MAYFWDEAFRPCSISLKQQKVFLCCFFGKQQSLTCTLKRGITTMRYYFSKHSDNKFISPRQYIRKTEKND
jgi:hypothetical protein